MTHYGPGPAGMTAHKGAKDTCTYPDCRDTVSDGTMPCPVPSPDGLPCAKTIPEGWTVEEGHGGGHFWISPKGQDILDSGHYDVFALISGRPGAAHSPEECRPGCPRWRL